MTLNIEVFDVEGVLFNKLSSRFHLIAHKDGEDAVGFDGAVDTYLEERARFRIERRQPQLLRIHLAETFITLDVLSAAPLMEDEISDAGNGADFLRLYMYYNEPHDPFDCAPTTSARG